MRRSPSSPSSPARMSAATRVTIEPMVRHEQRSNRDAALADISTAHHAASCSKARVWRAPGRAQGTPATTTPCWAHDTRGTWAATNTLVRPKSSARHRRGRPGSYRGHLS